MVVSAGKTESAPLSIVFAPLVNPRDVLGFLALEYRLANMRIVAVGAVSAFERVGAGHGGKNRSHPLHVLPKTHMVIPLVVYCKRPDPRAYGVIGQNLEFGRPMRIDRPVGFEVTTYPLEEMVSGSALRDLHPVVQAGQANSAFHDLVEFLEVGIEQVSPSPVAINDDRSRVVEDGWILGITIVRHHNRLETDFGFVQMLGEQLATGNMLV